MEPLELLKDPPVAELSATDALLTIAACVSGLDINPEEQTDMARLTGMALSHPLFPREADVVTRMINRVVNAVRGGDRQRAMELAIEALPATQKEAALAWAAEMLSGRGPASKRDKARLNELAVKLGVERSF